MHGRGLPGKLIAAARHWARAKPPAAESTGGGSAKAFGIVALEGYAPAATVVFGDDKGELGFPLDGNVFPVWPENHRAVRAFLKVRTQWIRDNGLATGLDGAAVETKVKRFSRVHKLTQEEEDQVFESIDIMEAVVVAEWAKEAKRELERARRRR